jgi:hypothetical protein
MAEPMDLAMDAPRNGLPASEGGADPSREGAMELKREGAMKPCRCCSHNLSLARISMFSKEASCESLTQSRVPRTSSSKKKDAAARREAYKGWI